MTTAVVEKRGYEPPTFRARSAGAGRRAIRLAHDAKILKSRVEEALETRRYEAAHRIRKHPFLAVAAAFAIALPLGVAAGWASTRRRRLSA
jgi:hypothetical protein